MFLGSQIIYLCDKKSLINPIKRLRAERKKGRQEVEEEEGAIRQRQQKIFAGETLAKMGIIWQKDQLLWDVFFVVVCLLNV